MIQSNKTSFLILIIPFYIFLISFIINSSNFVTCYGYDDYGYESEEPKEKALPPRVKELFSTEEIKEFIESDDSVAKIVAYFDLTTNENDKAEFDKIIADDDRLYLFAYTTSKQVLEETKYDGCAVFVYPPQKYISTKIEKSRHRYPSKTLKKEALQKFIRSKALPLVGERNYQTDMRYAVMEHLPQLFLFTEVDLDKNPKGYQYLVNRLRKIAVKYVGKMIFLIADKTKYDQDLDYFGMKGKLPNKKDIFVGIKSDMFYYRMFKPFTIENVNEFIENFFNGEIVGIERVDKEPEDEEENLPPKETEFSSDVIQLTNENFDKIINYTEKDILIDFYAPWCGHCKQLKPVINDVAKHFAKDSNVVIASFDATVNDIPKGYSVEGYPTLYFVSGEKRKAVNYQGQRDLDSIISYIDYHRSTQSIKTIPPIV